MPKIHKKITKIECLTVSHKVKIEIKLISTEKNVKEGGGVWERGRWVGRVWEIGIWVTIWRWKWSK